MYIYICMRIHAYVYIYIYMLYMSKRPGFQKSISNSFSSDNLVFSQAPRLQHATAAAAAAAAVAAATSQAKTLQICNTLTHVIGRMTEIDSTRYII